MLPVIHRDVDSWADDVGPIFDTVAFPSLSSVISDVAKQYPSAYLFKEILHLSTEQM